MTLPGGRPERSVAWDDLVVVGEALRPHGVHGALLVRPVAPDLSALLSLRRAFLGNDAGSVRELSVAAASPSGPFAAIRFEGIADREAASRLAGLAVLVPAAETAPLPDGRAYLFQNDVEQALFNLRQAQARNPDNLETRLFLAAALAARGERGEAEWEAEQIRTLEPGFSARGWLETYPLTSRMHQRKLLELLGGVGL